MPSSALDKFPVLPYPGETIGKAVLYSAHFPTEGISIAICVGVVKMADLSVATMSRSEEYTSTVTFVLQPAKNRTAITKSPRKSAEKEYRIAHHR